MTTHRLTNTVIVAVALELFAAVIGIQAWIESNVGLSRLAVTLALLPVVAYGLRALALFLRGLDTQRAEDEILYCEWHGGRVYADELSVMHRSIGETVCQRCAHSEAA